MENQEKKEYVAPQMTVEEFDHQGVLLVDSCPGDLSACVED